MAATVKSEFVSVQYLRALAALLVVYYHATGQFAGFERALPREFGAAGVDLFFVISGFIMVAITAARPMPPALFLLRRVLRIWPIYALYTTLTAAAIVAVPFLFRDSVFTIEHYALSLLFIAHPEPLSPATVSPMLKVGWTLNFEMFFYVLFALCLWLGGRRKVALLGAIMAVLVTVGQMAHFGTVPAFYSDPIILEFLFGAAIGAWFTMADAKLPPNIVAVGLIVLGTALCLSLPMEIHRAVRSGLGCAMILIGALSLERNRGVGDWRLPRLIGDGSYTLYLTHLSTVVALRQIWITFHLPETGLAVTLLFAAVCLTGATAIGVAAYWVIERPIVAWGHRVASSIGRSLPSGGALPAPRPPPVHDQPQGI